LNVGLEFFSAAPRGPIKARTGDQLEVGSHVRS